MSLMSDSFRFPADEGDVAQNNSERWLAYELSTPNLVTAELTTQRQLWWRRTFAECEQIGESRHHGLQFFLPAPDRAGAVVALAQERGLVAAECPHGLAPSVWSPPHMYRPPTTADQPC